MPWAGARSLCFHLCRFILEAKISLALNSTMFSVMGASGYMLIQSLTTLGNWPLRRYESDVGG